RRLVGVHAALRGLGEGAAGAAVGRGAMIALAWLASGVALAAASLTAINALTWPRGRADGRFDGRVSVLIPARDEAANIEACVRAVAASHHPVHEIVVYDDGSTDGTSELLARLRADVPALRVVNGDGLPQG